MDLSSYRKAGRPGELLRRALWECVQLPFYPLRPRRLSWMRVALLRMFGAKIGRNVLICGGVRVHVPWNLELGDYAAIGDKVEIYNLAPIRIGAHTTVSQHTYLCASSHDYTRSDFPLYSLPITVGAQAWIAALPDAKREALDQGSRNIGIARLGGVMASGVPQEAKSLWV